MALIRSRGLDELLRRDHTLKGGVLHGIEGCVVDLEARAVRVLEDARAWRSAVSITGMARGAVGEAVDRVTGAFAKLAIADPEVEILINLAPADLPKEGTWLDLPLAIIMLQAAGFLPDLPQKSEEELILLGELGLHGEVRRVPGALSMAYAASAGQTLVVPRGNERECALVTANAEHATCRVVSVDSLATAIAFFKGERALDDALSKAIEFESVIPRCIDFGKIKGQEKAKQGAVLAAAGGHNLLLIGPPGEGKSLLASAIPGILPRLSTAEKVQLTRIYSACGQLEKDGQIVSRRPMRPVHHSASKQALVGGGSPIPRPGEVTLAHLGILFLDELPEFPRPSIEALRQPIENGEVSIARVGASLTFPSRFTLVAAMNPCPCGYFGSDRCRCSTADVKRYQGKISGPILDRIDLQVELHRLSTEERFSESAEEMSPRLRDQIERARERQSVRYKGLNAAFNAAMPGGRIKEYAAFSPAAFEHYKKVIDSNTLTTRSMDRLAKVARTVADLADRDAVEAEDVDIAASFVIGGMLRESFA